MIARTVLEKKTLVGTHNSECLRLADCVVVDVQCDYRKRDLGNMRTGEAEMSALEATLKTIGDRIPPSCLVVRWAGRPVAVVDCFGILDDDRIRRYFVPGCEVEVLGRGHIQRIKEEVRGRRR